MRVPVASILNRCTVTEEVLGAPDHDMSLARRDLVAARRAPVGLLRAMGGDIADEPLSSGSRHTLSAAVRETGDVTRFRSV